jgi:hypothetical protein
VIKLSPCLTLLTELDLVIQATAERIALFYLLVDFFENYGTSSDHCINIGPDLLRVVCHTAMLTSILKSVLTDLCMVV